MPWEKAFDRSDALHSAMELFWERGYEETSMADLVAATGASRYGLYDEFGDKEELFQSALGHYRQHVVEPNLGDLLRDDASLNEIEAYFGRLNRFARSKRGQFGCLICHTAVGFAARNESIGEMVRAEIAWMTKIVERAIRNARAKGAIGSQKSDRQLARFLMGLVLGAAVYGRAGVPASVINDSLSAGIEAIR